MQQAKVFLNLEEIDFEKIYNANDLISGECFFIATGVTDGEILNVLYDTGDK